MSLETACQEYLEGGCKDGDILLVTFAEELDSGSTCGATSLLLHDRFYDVLVNLGWDLLSILTFHLPVISDGPVWELVHKIVDVGSPKEMCLALLEQMESLSSSGKTAAMFLMLHPLRKVLVRVSNEAVVNSALHSVFRLLQLHYHHLEEQQREEPFGRELGQKRSHSTSYRGCAHTNDHSTSELVLVDEEHEIAAKNEESTMDPCSVEDATATYQSHDQLQSSNDTNDLMDSNQTEPDFITVVHQVLDFISPSVNDLHFKATHPDVLFSGKHTTTPNPGPSRWSELQIECLAILLCLLDCPMVSRKLEEEKKEKQEQCSKSKVLLVAESIMSAIVRCHCGCVQLLTFDQPPLLLTSMESSEQLCTTEQSLSAVGLASFAHLLMVEDLESSYLPAVLRPSYLLSITLKHIITLVKRTEPQIVLKGLALLEAVLSRVQSNSLPPDVLENKGYLNLANVLTGTMVTCPNKHARQKSVSLLLKLVNVFTSIGRHKVYMNLLHSVSHSGVVGVLVQNIKNEVDSALRGPLSVGSPFLGSKLGPLMRKIFSASVDMDLLEEMDKLMSSLNFLRYLLIRDHSEVNKTWIWNMTDHVKDKFVTPVRQLLMSTKMHCKHELETRQEVKGHSNPPEDSKGPKVTMEVSGEKLSAKEELQMLHLASNQMDMVESVLVRVEELLSQ